METEAITLRNQTASPLLRLPPEIRDRIYHFALKYDGVVRIYPAPNGVDFCTESHSVHGCAAAWVTHQRPKDLRPDIRLRSTCRQISHEARNIYFACNTFAFTHSIHFGGRESFEDRHFKGPSINKIKTLSLNIGTCAITSFGGEPNLDRLLADRIDDMKGLQALSKVFVRVHECTEHLSNFPVGFMTLAMMQTALNPKQPMKATEVLEIIAKEFKTGQSNGATIYLVSEPVPEPDFTRKVHDVREWLDI